MQRMAGSKSEKHSVQQSEKAEQENGIEEQGNRRRVALIADDGHHRNPVSIDRNQGEAQQPGAGGKTIRTQISVLVGQG